MLDSNKESVKMDAMKRIINVSIHLYNIETSLNEKWSVSYISRVLMEGFRISEIHV